MKQEYRGLPSKVSSLRHDINEYLMHRMKKAGWKGISASHGGIMYSLFKNDMLSMKEIAKEVGRDPSTVTTLVNKLVKLGYAEFLKNPEDLRSKRVQLTKEGKGLYEEFNLISVGLTDIMLYGIKDEEIEQFSSVMKKMSDNLQKVQINQDQA